MNPPVAVVTGATGCVGRALVRRLVDQGVAVRAVSRSAGPETAGVTSIQADVRDAEALRSACTGADVVFHLAAYVHDVVSIDDTQQQQSVTLGGTTNALAAAERSGVKHFVFASSLAVHGPVNSVATEESPCAPNTPYGRAKLEAERAVSDFASRTGAFASSIRPAMIYGVGCGGNLPRMIRAVAARRFPPIPEFGNRRSMVWDSDVASAMIAAWRARPRGGRAFIVTDGDVYSTRRLYELILHALGRTPPGISIPRIVFDAAARIGDVGGRAIGRRLPFDTTALARIAGSAEFASVRAGELGFAPTQTLADALPAMIRHLERSGD